MNKRRDLFLLFRPDNVLDLWHKYKSDIHRQGYTIGHLHRFMNDEPPYIMVEYYTEGERSTEVCKEDGEVVFHFLIRRDLAKRFMHIMRTNQDDYLDYYREGVYTRNAKEHRLTPEQYARGAMKSHRPPKIKFITTLPRNMVINQ